MPLLFNRVCASLYSVFMRTDGPFVAEWMSVADAYKPTLEVLVICLPGPIFFSGAFMSLCQLQNGARNEQLQQESMSCVSSIAVGRQINLDD